MIDAGKKATREQICTAALLVLALLSRLGTFRTFLLPNEKLIWWHLETDERIYRALVEGLDQNFFHYSMQGSILLPKLSQPLYNHPLFFHPPLFVYSSWFLEKLFFFSYPMVPVLESLGTVLAVRSIARRLFPDDRTVICAVLLSATCPLGWFLSQKYWIDSLQVFTVTLSFATLLQALERARASGFVAAGLAIALAFLSKYLALIAFPALAALYFFRRGRSWRARELLALCLPTLLLGGCWLALEFHLNGEIFPAIPEWDPSKFPYMADIRARPWYYYFSTLALFTPVYLLALFPAAWRGGKERRFLWAWAASFFLGFTLLGQLPIGYITRFVAPAYPALALLAAPALARLFQRFRTAWIGAGLIGVNIFHCVAYGLFFGPMKPDFDISLFDLARHWLSLALK